jgi:hypothetical protein
LPHFGQLSGTFSSIFSFLAFDSFDTIWHDNELRGRAERAFTFLIAELKTLESIYASLNIEES